MIGKTPEYIPDRWTLLKAQSPGNPTTYRVHAGWSSSSYLTGPEWRTSSPIRSIRSTRAQLTIQCASGSTYICHKNYGLTTFSATAIHTFGTMSGEEVTPVEEEALNSEMKHLMEDRESF